MWWDRGELRKTPYCLVNLREKITRNVSKTLEERHREWTGLSLNVEGARKRCGVEKAHQSCWPNWLNSLWNSILTIQEQFKHHLSGNKCTCPHIRSSSSNNYLAVGVSVRMIMLFTRPRYGVVRLWMLSILLKYIHLSVHQISPKPLQLQSWNSHIVYALPRQRRHSFQNKFYCPFDQFYLRQFKRIGTPSTPNIAQIINLVLLSDRSLCIILFSPLIRIYARWLSD